MRMEEIRKEFDRKYPNDSHNTEATIRSYIQRDDRIESIGRTSIYKLTSWGGFSGSIPELLIRLLAIKGRPVQSRSWQKKHYGIGQIQHIEALSATSTKKLMRVNYVCSIQT